MCYDGPIVNGESCQIGPQPNRTFHPHLGDIPMNRVLVLVQQNGIRTLNAPTNTTKKGRRSRRQTKSVNVINPIREVKTMITVSPASEAKSTPCFKHLPADTLVASFHPNSDGYYLDDSYDPSEVEMERVDEAEHRHRQYLPESFSFQIDKFWTDGLGVSRMPENHAVRRTPLKGFNGYEPEEYIGQIYRFRQRMMESRSHSRSKLRYTLRINRRNHPRNAALLAA